jgi:hypothetical protein
MTAKRGHSQRATAGSVPSGKRRPRGTGQRRRRTVQHSTGEPAVSSSLPRRAQCSRGAALVRSQRLSALDEGGARAAPDGVAARRRAHHRTREERALASGRPLGPPLAPRPWGVGRWLPRVDPAHPRPSSSNRSTHSGRKPAQTALIHPILDDPTLSLVSRRHRNRSSRWVIGDPGRTPQ